MVWFRGPGWGLTCLLVIWGNVALAQPKTSNFSRHERARLARGELVVRQEARRHRGLRLIGGTAFQVIDAAPDRVWRTVMNVPSWRRFVPEVVEARVLRQRQDQRKVFLRHAHGPIEASYVLDFSYLAGRRMARFELDKSRPHAIREGWGFFTVSPFGKSRTLVTFGIMADVGTGLLTSLARPQVHNWMLKVPSQLRRFLERRRPARSG